MKKTIAIFSLLLFTCYLFAQNGVVRELSGTVELKNSGGTFAPAKVGDQVGENTVISTGFKSTALIEVGSAMLAVRPLTRLTLTEISASAGSETLNVNLAAGRVKVDLNPPAGTRASMAVSSPSATASVRGTSFEFDTRNLNVESGGVSFRGNRRQEYVVYGGSVSSVGNYGTALDPVGFGYSGLSPSPPSGPGGGSAGVSPGSIGGGAGIGSPAADPGGPSGPSSPGGPRGPSIPSGPSGPSGPGNTGGSDDGGAGIGVDFK